MAPPTNTSAATATMLTPPALVSQDVSGAAAPLYEVWFQYTASAADVLVGWWAAAAAASGYVPGTIFLQGTPANLQPAFGFSGRVTHPVQVQMAAGVTYYFQVQQTGASTPTSALLQLSLTRAPNLAAPAGSLAINDDTPGFPLVLLSTADGSVLQAQPFPAGETGHALPNGRSVWHDYDVTPAVVRLYDPTLTLVATPPWSFRGTAPPLSSNRSTTFYLGDPGGTFPAPTQTARVTTVDPTGTLGPTIWTLPQVGLLAIAPTRNDTVLYHMGQSSAGSSIQRWDLLGNAALSPLAGTLPGYAGRKDLLVLADDSIVAGYYQASPIDSVVRRYSPAGALLTTYPLGAVELNRLSHALDDPASFWVWTFLQGASTGISRFLQLRVSDGAVLTSVDSVRYEGGDYRPALPPPPPPVPTFGHSPSCPFVVLPPGFGPYVPTGTPPGGGGGGGNGGTGGSGGSSGGGSSLPDGRPIRRLRRAPHLSTEQLEQFFARFQLDLEVGIGQPTDPGLDPQVALRWSDDGGQTWRGPLSVSAGGPGQFKRRAIWRRLGRGRDRVFEVSMTDPVKWALVAASLDALKGTS